MLPENMSVSAFGLVIEVLVRMPAACDSHLSWNPCRPQLPASAGPWRPWDGSRSCIPATPVQALELLAAGFSLSCRLSGQFFQPGLLMNIYLKYTGGRCTHFSCTEGWE